MIDELREDVAKILFRAVTIKHPELYTEPNYTSPWDTKDALLKSGLSKTHQEAELTLAISTAWLVANFLDYFPPVAVGLTGGKVALSRVFFEHRDQFDLCPFSWPLHEASEYAYFYEYHRKNGFSAADVFERFALVSFGSGSIRAKNGTRHFLINGSGLPPEEADEALELANRLGDFVLCWEEPVDGSDYRLVLELMEVTPELQQAITELSGPVPTEAEGTRAGPGRPNKVAPVLDYLEKLPTSETAALTHKELARRIQDDIGVSASTKTVARALAEARKKAVPE
jgi:hypothetical protein